jgi:hypothetical protein
LQDKLEYKFLQQPEPIIQSDRVELLSQDSTDLKMQEMLKQFRTRFEDLHQMLNAQEDAQPHWEPRETQESTVLCMRDLNA